MGVLPLEVVLILRGNRISGVEKLILNFAVHFLLGLRHVGREEGTDTRSFVGFVDVQGVGRGSVEVLFSDEVKVGAPEIQYSRVMSAQV